MVILPPKEFGWLGSTVGLMSIGLLIVVSVTIGFYGVALLAPRPTPNLEDQVLPFVSLLTQDQSGVVEPARSHRLPPA